MQGTLFVVCSLQDEVAQLSQLGVGGVLSEIVGSDKDTEDEDSEEEGEEAETRLEGEYTAPNAMLCGHTHIHTCSSRS